jgi:hypothetical protein
VEPRPAAVDVKADLHRYLQRGRDVLLWKLEGLSEYDKRRPMVPTGTNLLGLVKHMAGVEAGYFGAVFGRPFPERLPFLDDDDEWTEPNADMWATAEETTDEIAGLYRRVWSHADETIDALPLDAVGRVPWWPEERREPALQVVVVHVLADLHRHAGHADILREQIDGGVGMLPAVANVPGEWDQGRWAAHRERVERAAREAAG